MPERRCGTIIFDLDDTLLDTSDVYWRVRSHFIALLARAGFDREEATELFETVDAEHMAQFGFSPLRYSKSMEATFERLNRHKRVLRPDRVLASIERFGQLILSTTPQLIDGALELLRWCEKRFVLALVTRGQLDLQRKKLQRSRLETFFTEIRIVPDKSAEIFNEIFATCNAPSGERWVIGDSIKTDINLGIQIGAHSILFEYRHPVYQWRYEANHLPAGAFHKIRKLRDAIPILSRTCAAVAEKSLMRTQLG